MGYRSYFKARQSWTAVLDIIAKAMGMGSRTLSRLISNSEQALKLPQYVLEEMIELKLDPTETKNRGVVAELARAPKPSSREQAAENVKSVYSAHLAVKKAAKRPATSSDPDSLDDFARRIVRLFEGRLRSMPPSTRDTDIRYVLQKVAKALRADVVDLKTYNQPDPVQKPIVEGEHVEASAIKHNLDNSGSQLSFHLQ
jgi:hypothetical protein